MFGWRQRKRAVDLLIEQIIQEGIERRKIDAEVASKEREFKLKTLEIEMEHLAEKREEDRKDRAEREANRRARQAAAAAAREAGARKRALGNSDGGCKVCLDPSDPSLTERDITWHVNGHREGPSLWN